MLGRSELRDAFGIRAAAAIVGYGDLVLDPRAATCALLRAASDAGAAIYAPADVTDIDPGKSRVLATGSTGRTIRAKRLVLATGFEFPKQVPQRGHEIVATWAIATAPQPRRLWPTECMIWEAADPYLYVRTTPDGRVICGGEDEEFSDEEQRNALIETKTRTLERELKRLLPGIDSRADFTWTGSFGQRSTGLPPIRPTS